MTKKQTVYEINAFNGKFLPSEKARKRLQLFINRITILDELNRYRNSGREIDALKKENNEVILYLSRKNDELQKENDALNEDITKLIHDKRVLGILCTMFALSMCFLEKQFIRFGLIMITGFSIAS